MSYRSGNPALSSKVFENEKKKNNGPLIKDDVMTIKGTVDKTAMSLLLLLMTAYFSYTEDSTIFMIGGGIGGFIVALVTIFKKHLSPITSCRYFSWKTRTKSHGLQ